MKTLPFNLEKALAGAKVVTRDGRVVTQLHVFEVSDPWLPLAGVVDGVPCFWHPHGSYPLHGDTSSDLLLVVPEPVVRWVNFYGVHDWHPVADHFDTREEADRELRHGVTAAGKRVPWERLYGRAIRVEIEPDGAA